MQTPITQNAEMAANELVSFRTDPGSAERATRLAGHFENLPGMQVIGITKSRVLSMALQRGLELLEQEQGITKKKGRKR